MKGDDYLSDSSQETDELDELGLQSANAGNIGNTQVDEIPGAIESANCRVFSTRELYEKMNNDRIDVEPPYQRDVVWPRSSQSALIDSIFKNKWVPTLLFSLRPAHLDRKGKLVKEKWVCMDGKQRLTSVKLFMDGEIPWIERPGTSWYYKQSNPPSPSRMILSEERMEVWLSRGLTTALYSKLSELQERDIFRLVQEGKPLTIGEKMQAAAGAWGEYFDEMTQLYMTNNEHNPNGWCTRIAHLKRGADFKTMTSIILLIRDRLLRPTEAPRFLSSITLQKELTLLLNEKVPEELKKEVTQLLDSFMKVTMLAPPKTRWMVEPHTPDALFYPIIKGRKTMISPVELIWIPYLISVHGPKVSLGRVLELIRNLKIDLRKQYPREVKNNLQVTNFIKEWIHNYDLSKLTGCYKGYDVPAPPLDEEEGGSANSNIKTNKDDIEVPCVSKRKAEPLSGVSDTQPSGTVFKRPRRAGPTPIPASQPTPRTAPTPASASQPASRAGPTPLTASQGASRALTAQPPRSSLPVGRPSSLFDPNKFSSNNLSTESPTARSSAASNAQASISGRHHTFENQTAQAAERAMAVANSNLSLQSSGANGTNSQSQNRSNNNSSAVRLDSQSHNGTSRFLNYQQTNRPQGFQLPTKASASTFNPQNQAGRPLGSSVTSKVRYNQFASGDFSRPSTLPNRSQDSITPSVSPASELFRMESPNPYASHRGPAWRTVD